MIGRSPSSAWRGVAGPVSAATLRRGRIACARLTARHGTTYFWGAMLLPGAQRRDVFAVYAVCRIADDIVDEPDQHSPHVPDGGSPAERLAAFRTEFEAVVHGGRPTVDPVLAVVAETVARRRIPRDCFDRFFDAMALDLTVTSWPNWPALRDGYMEGSAAVIGEMMLPVLEPTDEAAFGPARSLGLAFQLTNFLRDVAEDADRGRCYLPVDELAGHGVEFRGHGAGVRLRVTPQWRAFLAAQIARNRAYYREAEKGLAYLPPPSARCVGTALLLYEQILDRIEADDHDVFSGRIRVPTVVKVATAVRVALAGHPRRP